MNPFEREVIDRLARIETNQSSALTRVADHEKRLDALEALKVHATFLAAGVGAIVAVAWKWVTTRFIA